MFIGGLSATTTIEDVKQYFEQFGKVRGQLFIYVLCGCSVYTQKLSGLPEAAIVHLLFIQDFFLKSGEFWAWVSGTTLDFDFIPNAAETFQQDPLCLVSQGCN